MSIIERAGRFGVKAWDPGTGRYRWLGTFETRQLAEQAESDATLRPGKDSPTVEQWGRIWLSDYARAAPATRQVYRQAVNAITASLGGRRLGEVDRPTARRQAIAWPRNTSSVARTMWADAVRDGVTRENPWTNMRLKQSRGRRDIVALTERQLEDLAAMAESVHGDYGREVRAMIIVLAYTGLRPGELCALRWGDINLRSQEIFVQRSLDATRVEKLPKNGLTRVITIPPLAVDALRSTAHRLGSGYVFHTTRGRRLSKSTLHYAWRTVAKAWLAAGNHDLDLYELRHSCATMLLERGLSPGDVAVQLGHTDGGALVMERYGHPSEDLARERLKMAFGGSQRSITDAADPEKPRRTA